MIPNERFANTLYYRPVPITQDGVRM